MYPGFRHVEYVAAGSIDRVARGIQAFQDAGIQPKEIHGRMGYSWAYSLAKNACSLVIQSGLVSSEKLIDRFGKSIPILVHDPEARRKYVIFTRTHPYLLLVEGNDPGVAGVDRAKVVVDRFHDNGINAGVIADVRHMVGAIRMDDQKAFFPQWDRSLSYLRTQTSFPTNSIYGIHVPIGILHWDSLPIGWISRNMWKDLSDSLGPSVREVVVENLPDECGFIAMSARGWTSFVRRTQQTLDTMAESGLLQF